MCIFNRNAVQWVADEIGEVEVEIRNPLRAPVEVTDMTVLYDGAEMDAHPATFRYSYTGGPGGFYGGN